MKIGLIDVDSHNFPSLPLMKLSAWHRKQGDTVEWYSPMFSGYMDMVHMSKVFSFTPDYQYFINADMITMGGTGYGIEVIDREETYYPEDDLPLLQEIEHIYPDYSLYPELTRDTAYGFLTRGCPRNCDFCHVGAKEGCRSRKVADLAEFWCGQKNIVLLDPNLLACRESKELLGQLIESEAQVDFSQGLDIRLMTQEKAELLKQVRVKRVHFAWDKYCDKNAIVPKLKEFKEFTGWDIRKMSVYVLVGYNSTLEEDLERIYTLRELGYWPFVMVYNKEKLPARHILKKLQRWVNMRAVFQTVPRFEDYVDK